MSIDEAIDYRDHSRLRKAGVEALTSALGPVGMAYFMRQFDKGRGNYTTERERLLSGIDLDEIVRDVYNMEKAKRE